MKTAAEESMEDAKAYFDLWKAAEAREKAMRERLEQAERALAERNSLIERLRRSLEAAPNPSHMQGYSFKYSRWYWEMRPAALALTPTAASALAAAEREVVEAAGEFRAAWISQPDDYLYSLTFDRLMRAIGALAALKAKEVGDGR